MKTLWLNFKDQNGDEQRVPVEDDAFTIGRHSASGLCIVDSRLSRDHAVIEKQGAKYLISDRGSSNGTKLNGEEVLTASEIRDGDEINLGGFLIKAELAEVEPQSTPPEAEVAENPSAAESPPTTPPVQKTKKKKGMPTLLLLMIPMFAIVILLFAGVLIYVLVTRDSGKPKNTIVVQDPSGDDDIDDDGPKKPPKTPVAGQPTPDSGGTTNEPPGGGLTPPPTISPTAVVEEAGAKFLRAIAHNEPRAFLTLEQAKRVDDRAKGMKGSAGIAENINSARKNSKAIADLASANNLKPQFLAVAAIAKLGSTRGDVVATAKSMAEVFGKLGPHIGTERSDDALLMVAAYDQGVAGETMKLRNMLQALANDNPESTREIRTIWFLEKEGKITKPEFERALTFLAVGTLTQNPKAFGVNAEALAL